MLRKGVFLLDRKTDDFTIFLFQVDGFYIEIFLTSACDEIILIKTFDRIDELDPYLNDISIPYLAKDLHH